MKKRYRFKVYFIFFSFILSLTGGSATNAEIPDSLLTKDHVYQYTFSDPEKAKQIIQLMRKRKAEPDHLLDIIEGDIYYNNGKINEALVLYTRALNSEAVQNDPVEYMEQLHRMISCYGIRHDEEKKAYYVKLLLDKANETGNREMRSVALFEMGKMIHYQEDKQRGYQLMKEAIEEMKQSDYGTKYNNLRYYYNNLLVMQQRDGLYEDALETLDDLESVVTETTQKATYIEGLDRKEIKTLLALRAVVLGLLDRFEEADEAYRQWKVAAPEYTKEDYLVAPYLMRRKRFDDAIELYGRQENHLYEQNDTINYHMRTIKRLVGRAYEGKGDYKKATQYFKELSILTDSLKVREQRSAAVELAILYETHEKELKLQEQTTHIKVRNILLVSAGVAILFLIIILWRNIKHSRIIRHKNKLMAASIEELLVYKEELFEAKDRLNLLKEKGERMEHLPVENANNPVGTTGTGDENDTSDIPEDKMLFETLDAIIVREKLYLNPNLSREDLMKLIQVNKNRFAQIIQKYAGTHTTSYINNKRLEYGARLLKTHPEYTIAAIAELSGIPNVPTFNRLFKGKFGMTPTEFRDSL